jgi:hypothetical protein
LVEPLIDSSLNCVTKSLSGKHLRLWNGIDRRHHPVTSEIYFCQLIAGELRETKKLVLLR